MTNILYTLYNVIDILLYFLTNILFKVLNIIKPKYTNFTNKTNLYILKYFHSYPTQKLEYLPCKPWCVSVQQCSRSVLNNFDTEVFIGSHKCSNY